MSYKQWDKWSYDNPPVEGAFLTERGWEIENEAGIREVLVAIGGGAVSDEDKADHAEIDVVDAVEASQTNLVDDDVLQVEVFFTEEVDVDTSGGTPSIPLYQDDGTTSIGDAGYASGSGTNRLVFEYTIQNGDSEETSVKAGADIALNSGTITDKIGGGNVTVTFDQVTLTDVTINVT